MIIIIIITPWILIVIAFTNTQKGIALIEVTVFICKEPDSLWKKELSQLSLYNRKYRVPSWTEMIWGRMKGKTNGGHCHPEMAWKFPTPSFINGKIIHQKPLFYGNLVFVRHFVNIFLFNHKTLRGSLTQLLHNCSQPIRITAIIDHSVHPGFTPASGAGTQTQ